MITSRQIRAARALLGWDAADLAEKAGLTRATLSNIENSLVQARAGTLQKIAHVFDQNGVEFIENEGVRIKPTTVDVYEGIDRFNEFYEFLYQHMLERGGEVCLSVVEEKLLAKYRKNPEVQRQRMRELVKSGYVSYRVLVTEGDFTGDYVEYKQQPAHAAAPTAFYAFGECLALISFPENSPPPYVVVIRSVPLTESYRQSFHTAWEKASPISAEDIEKAKQLQREKY